MYESLSQNSSTTLITKNITQCRSVLKNVLTIIKASISASS